ncbi:hypothetical protein [Streptomyces violascens]|uniref:hypothetical protein n=1 Tax=Streptomyces violascens TaxID=67381 RepID=UPI001671F27B|nr:hypothetical protein [Streptomyces violascens]
MSPSPTGPAPAGPAPLVGTMDLDAELGRLLDSLTAAQLYDIEIACVQRQSAHYGRQLVTALRHRTREVVAARETDSRWPVVGVVFGTCEWDNGWFWEPTGLVRHLDGTRSNVDLDFDDVSGLLADLSGTERLCGGERLRVDLLTGDVTTS